MTRNDGHKLFRKLIEKYPNDASLMLIDIITDYFMFPLDEDKNIHLYDDLSKDVRSIYDGSTASKVKAIKYVKDRVNWTLKEAKEFVENGTLPTYSNNSDRQQILNYIFAKIKKDYHIN